jgi:hypothetical protein
MKLHCFRRLFLVSSIGCVIVLAIVGTLGRSWLEDLLAEPAPTTSLDNATSGLSAEEQEFFDAVVPRMFVVTAEANVLAELGKAHSRNLFELQARGNRVEENASKIEAYATVHGVPSRFEPAYGTFSDGVALLRTAMSESRQGMLTLNWDRVADSIGIFESGADEVSSATNSIKQAAAGSTPGPD